MGSGKAGEAAVRGVTETTRVGASGIWQEVIRCGVRQMAGASGWLQVVSG